MDLLKLLSSLEELVVEVALWIILLPRTLFCALFAPVTLAQYFDRTYAVPLKERDDEYLSPVLFWIILGPLSLLLVFVWQDQRTLALYGSTLSERIVVAILMLMGSPLGFALAMVALRLEPISRRTLGRQFSLQCYFHAPMAFLFVMFMSFQQRYEGPIGDALAGIMLLAGIWFLIIEFRVARRKAEDGNAAFSDVRAAASVGLGCGFSFLLVFSIGCAVMLILFLIGRLPSLSG